jgi:hypothetical protein
MTQEKGANIKDMMRFEDADRLNKLSSPAIGEQYDNAHGDCIVGQLKPLISKQGNIRGIA